MLDNNESSNFLFIFLNNENVMTSKIFALPHDFEQANVFLK